MEVEITKDAERNILQLWSVDMTSEARDTNYVRFDRYFTSKLRILLRGDNPKIPQALLEIVKPKDYATRLLVSHNWGM